MPRRRSRRLQRQRGVTLIELVIAVTLVAAILTGLLFAMGTSVITYTRMDQRLQEDRREMGLERALENQIGGVMPVLGICADEARRPAFSGNEISLRFVSSYSLAEGARGYARIVEYQVAPDPRGGVRLLMNERVYAGPQSLAPLCTAQGFSPIQITPQSVEMEGRLAYCRISYRLALPGSAEDGPWGPVWDIQPNLPDAVRIDMAPLDPVGTANGRQLPVLSLDVPIHVTRVVASPYEDR